MLRPEEQASILTDENILFAFELFVNRPPTSEELSRLHKTTKSPRGLANHFFRSREFRKRLAAHQAMVAQRNPPALIHLHIPKCGGTSLTSIIGASRGSGESLAIDHGDIERFLQTPDSELRRLSFIFGHLEYGFASNLPQGAVYVCALRRPGPRIYSYFNYVKQTQAHPLHSFVYNADMSFGQFLEFANSNEGQRFECENGQVKRLAGKMQILSPSVDRELFQRAIRNMFADDMIIGLTENLDLLLQKLQQRDFIGKYTVVVKNALSSSDSFEDAISSLSDFQLGVLQDFTYWDNMLYDIAESYVLG